MRITCISDLHGFYPKLGGGDLLVIAGDLTANDKPEEYNQFFKWLSEQNYEKKVFISGNHDNQAMSQFDWYDAEYLYDSGTVYQGLKIWGSPWTKYFNGMNKKYAAFTRLLDQQLAEKWALIPQDTDILITHCPPYGILDGIIDDFATSNDSSLHIGSPSLRNTVLNSNLLPKLKLHVFGHIHEWGGKLFETTMAKFVNASVVDENYKYVNNPVDIIL